MIVFMLYHTRARANGDDDKLIGIYTTRQKAEAAIEKLLPLPGFRDHPAGFGIFEHALDRDGWTEGFVTADE